MNKRFCLFGDMSVVPVVMFHSVGQTDTDWVFNHISEPLTLFRGRVEMLAKRSYKTVHWADLYDHMSSRRELPARTVMLTFDDGYLDNWVYVFPLIKQYRIKITIFVNPEFVDPAKELRPNLQDVAEGRIGSEELESKGFLSWSELRAMEESGLVDIQSHAMSHTWHFAGPRVVDFYRPVVKHRYPWLAWNARPDRKPFYMNEDQSSFVPWGLPVYEHEKSLVCRRYLPSKDLTDLLANRVLEEGGPAFFEKIDWEKRLREYHRELTEANSLGGCYETDEEYRRRVLEELLKSKAILEKELKRTIDFICWPGGGYNEIVLGAAKEAGYKSWTLSSRDQSGTMNKPGAPPHQIKRIGSASKYVGWRGRTLGYSSPFYFHAVLERHRQSILHRWLSRILVLRAMVRSFLRLG